jgi:hypothetical protein
MWACWVCNTSGSAWAQLSALLMRDFAEDVFKEVFSPLFGLSFGAHICCELNFWPLLAAVVVDFKDDLAAGVVPVFLFSGLVAALFFGGLDDVAPWPLVGIGPGRQAESPELPDSWV